MIWFYLLTLFCLGIYSYSQIDLNLTLLQTPWFLSFQQAMIQLGYFQRPLSSLVFVVLLSLLSIFSVVFFYQSKSLTTRQVILLIGGVCGLGLLSYPAFSHDLFNSIFYPRIIIDHQANPYQVTALMFPTDTWTRFMHWTHNTYQWGPVYLLLTIPFYLFGLGKFVLTLLSFKLMNVLAYLGSSYLVYKMAKNPGLILFALNPLIILEAVVSGHLDIIMLFFALLALFYLGQKRKILALIFLALSVGTKFTTILLTPVFFRRSEAALILLAVFAGLTQVYFRDLLPHYFIVTMGVISLYPHRKKLVVATMTVSILLLVIRYLPFLYTGQWLTVKF